MITIQCGKGDTGESGGGDKNESEKYAMNQKKAAAADMRRVFLSLLVGYYGAVGTKYGCTGYLIL